MPPRAGKDPDLRPEEMLEGTAEDAQRAEGEAQVQGDRDARETMGEKAYRASLAPEGWQGPPREHPREACSPSPQWDCWLPADWGLQHGWLC